MASHSSDSELVVGPLETGNQDVLGETSPFHSLTLAGSFECYA